VYDMLCAMGCDLAQGYFLSRPLPALDLTDFLRGRSGNSSAAG
jgi:EAL domain-containing protein (putative c-di-GMP-specific phosphodiesterase class I)